MFLALKGCLPASMLLEPFSVICKKLYVVPIDHILEIHPYFTEQFMAIDHNTQRHLELLEPLHENNSNRTLIGLLDKHKLQWSTPTSSLDQATSTIH